MLPRFAYWIKDKAPVEVAHAIPARIRAAWPNMPDDSTRRMMCVRHPSGSGTLIVFPANDGAAVQFDQSEAGIAEGRLAGFGKPRETFDGMIFYPSLVTPSREWLIRPEESRPKGEWVKTYDGELHISVAFVAPRRLLLCAGGGYRSGDAVTEYGRLAHDCYEDFSAKGGGLKVEDSRLWRLLFLAIRESYWVTEEAIESLEWLTDADILPVISTAMGCSPKPSAAEPAGSPSSAPTIPASP